MRDLAFDLSEAFGANIWRAQLEERGAPSPSRSAPCPCGSGEKYKRCCVGR
jgi:uncharacterized protein YecA (UPF0149 family)